MISPEPEIELLPKILVCWHLTDNGRYSLGMIDFIFGEKTIENKTKKTISGFVEDILLPSGEIVEVDPTVVGYIYEFESDDFYEEYKSLNYILHNAGNNTTVIRNISKDAQRIYNDKNVFNTSQNITYILLNNVDLAEILYKVSPNINTVLRNDYPIRIYWYGSDEGYEVKVYGKYRGSVKFDEKREWYYVDFRFDDSECIKTDAGVEYSITRNYGSSFLKGKISNWDLIPEKIDGEIYYVFYAN